jgi:peptidoglycan/xylan/chitin deacetylase (PgdA/CDA1 family)
MRTSAPATGFLREDLSRMVNALQYGEHGGAGNQEMTELFGLLSLLSVLLQAPARREIAVTFDDVPGVSVMRRDWCDAGSYADMNRRIVRTAAANRIPALGLVVEGRLCERRHDALPGILSIWLDAGLELGNHTYSHPDLNNTPLARYEADVIRGETVTKKLLARRGAKLRYFRHPFLHAGKDSRTKAQLEKFLKERGYTLAPVTVDNQEWVFGEVYTMALDRNDSTTARRVANEYLRYMDGVFDFFEKRSKEVTGREIRQILLLHVSPLNADYFDDLIRLMRRRGYSFVSVERALEDPAYRLRDGYIGPTGYSWIHRWGLGRGIPVRDEPREPAWLEKLRRDYANGARR